MKNATIVMTGLAVALTTGMAIAADCPDNPASKPIVESARNKRAAMLEKLFDTQFGCLALEKFSEKVNQLALDASTTITNPCVLKGIYEASNATIDKMFKRCLGSLIDPDRVAEARLAAGECETNGSEAGRLGGTAFCELVGGGTDVNVCESVSTQACKNAFRSYVLIHCADKARTYPDDYKTAVDLACIPA